MIKLGLFLIGLVALTGLVWHVGPGRIVTTLSILGPIPLILIFLPLFIVYVLEAYGWYLTLGAPHAPKVGLVKLFMVRMAGEVINVTTPTGYVGGEPMKAYLLGKYGVPLVEGGASVVTAKTTMTMAQVMFILMGLAVMVWVLGATDHNMIAVLVSVGVLACGLGGLVIAQRVGIGTGLLWLLRKLGIRLAWLEQRESQIRQLDDTIRRFYTERRGAFYASVSTFLVAWMTETFEVFAILYFLGVPVDWLSSFAIAALSVLIKGSVFFIPGSIGAQEAGYLLLLLGFGYDEVTGIAFALIRRLREILWIGIGLVFLMVLKGKNPLALSSSSSSY